MSTPRIVTVTLTESVIGTRPSSPIVAVSSAKRKLRPTPARVMPKARTLTEADPARTKT
jgi:hypothetical protein